MKAMNNMKCIECGGKLVPTTISYTLKCIPPIEIHYLEGYRGTQCLFGNKILVIIRLT